MNVADLVQLITGLRPAWPAFEQQPVLQVVVDSRQVKLGSVFVAEHSGQRDGHEFIPDALQRGAVAVVTEAHGLPMVAGLVKIQVGDPAQSAPQLTAPLSALPTPLAMVVPDTLAALQSMGRAWQAQMPAQTIGITGSVGKTTTKELVSAVLARRFDTIQSEANFNNEIGLPLTLLSLRPHHQRAVLEMRAYRPGEMTALCEMARPHIGVVTNIGPSYLQRMGSLDMVQQVMSELPASLPPQGMAILNGDDPRVRAMRDVTRARVFLYGLTPDCDLWASNLDSHGLEGIGFRVHYGRESLYVRVPLLGRHSVHTALRAIAVGLVEGMTWEEIIAGLQSIPGQVRLVVVRGVNGTTILDDTYNASPDSSLAALNLLREMPGRRIAVLGDMLELGSLEAEGHEMVGCRAAEIVNRLVAVGERARMIADGARGCGMPAEHIEWYPDPASALAALWAELQSGDFVLIKGSRGMRMETIVTGLAADSQPKGQG
ncbi:MAG: UDP-N-acetylmuramoyl-tripeptide--D-alanyl-D-alanine ligase [Anaerolineae bacterium]|nr:UDP-N-acetylmuramoyl-tripeptide--D-alanyl-D-alanine ligase [Anaerolineae bacterium]